MVSSAPELVYKVATAAAVSEAEAAGSFAGMPVDHRDGFIHLSTADQLAETLALHFRGQSELVLLAVRSADVADALRWEPSRGGELFPHLYAALPMAAVAWTAPVAVAEDGSAELPEGLA